MYDPDWDWRTAPRPIRTTFDGMCIDRELTVTSHEDVYTGEEYDCE